MVETKTLPFYRFILIAWFLEVILVAGTSAPHTVYHSVNVPWANHIIQSQPIKPNPFIPNHTDQEALKWGKYIGFSWKSKTFYTKQFSSLWFNPLRIKTHPETKNYLEIELTDTTPFIGLIKKNSLGKYQVYEDKNIQFKVITNQHWRIQYSTDISEERFLFLKQRFIPGWQAFSNQDTTEIKQTQNGYMLIDLNTVKNNTFDLIYDSNKYKISFWISICLLGIILLLNFSLSSYKLEWGGFFIIVLFIAFVYNQHRFCSFTKDPITKENSIENVDFFNTNFYLLNYWKNKRDTIYIPQNVPKTDKDIAFIYFNYPNFVKNICVGKSEYIMRTKREKPTTIEEMEATTDASHFHYNLYPLVKTQQLYRNVLLFRLNYLASPDSKLRLWIVHKRAGEWRDGETWTLSTNSLSNTEKQLVVTKDISAFDLMPGDELTLFVWGDADSLFNWNNFSIHVLPF